MNVLFYNTLTRKHEVFTPIDDKNVRMYVCGPTVYDRPHLGNARSVVVYDVLYRMLMMVYGPQHVTYVRNITDVDDKINAAAKTNGEPISALTKRVDGWFHEDIAALGVLPATKNLTGKETVKDAKGIMGEPHATHHIPHMVAMIEKLIANGNAYVSQGHVLFAVNSYKDYGQLSGRKLDELVAGARVEVESYKKHPGDFVLWKPADAEDDASSVFPSPWSAGRPGWHIECSAMSSNYLGDHFDIHGGGADLMFPHHENEIAQSRCAMPDSKFANYWVHNGFLTVGGEKMSKSLGNFTTVRDLLDKGVKGEVIRLALLSAKYNEPLDWNENLVHNAKQTLDHWYRTMIPTSEEYVSSIWNSVFVHTLTKDLNVPSAISQMFGGSPHDLYAKGRILGFFNMTADEWFKGTDNSVNKQHIEFLINNRIAAKKSKNWAEADKIRKELAEQGIILEDRPDGTTDWRKA
jgi:cysteinyl-tRNA synthetase